MSEILIKNSFFYTKAKVQPEKLQDVLDSSSKLIKDFIIKLSEFAQRHRFNSEISSELRKSMYAMTSELQNAYGANEGDAYKLASACQSVVNSYRPSIEYAPGVFNQLVAQLNRAIEYLFGAVHFIPAEETDIFKSPEFTESALGIDIVANTVSSQRSWF